MKWTLFFLLLAASNSSLSQKCVVFQNEEKQPISYVSVSTRLQPKGISTEQGKFCFDKTLLAADTFYLSAIGYKTKALPAQQLFEFVNLERQEVLLPEVVAVNGTPVSEVWGTTQQKGFHCTHVFQNPDQSIGKVIMPVGNYRKAVLKNVAFYDHTGRNLNTPVRLRVFLLGKDSLPTGDYLRENIIVSTQGTGWFVIDLEEKGLVMPKEGLAFVLELFDFDRQYYFTQTVVRKVGGKKTKQERSWYGFSVAMTGQREGLTLIKMNDTGRWLKRTGNGQCGSVVGKVEVEVWR